ncbi:MAG TPA: cellulase family glycosylhydrolase, partial [Roseiflexaceae bacterium]|nr:cellulase family glycosylhydrolase [Roseiflexaceae bacterium]
MSKRRLKLVIWALLLLVSMAGAAAVISGAANLLAYFQQGADPASALNIVPNVPPDLHVRLSWRESQRDTGRQIEPFTRSQIEASYLRAWLQWNFSYLKREPYGLKTYFAGPALAAAGDAVRQATAQGLRVDQVDTAHELELQFYSADGAIVAFTDHDALVAQLIRDPSGAVVYAGETRADYDVVMLLEDGNWRVRHWVRRDADNPIAQRLPLPPPARKGFVTVEGKQLMLDGRPFPVAGLNYYPRNTPWDRFWANYSTAETDRDFTLIRALGLNSVRTFIPFEQFGGPKVDPAMLDKLEDFLDRADANGLKVLLTLFDFRTDYQLLLWAQSDRHLETLLTRFRDHPAILAWDMKNEPNNDYGSNGAETVDAWLAHTARLAHIYAPNHLITIGWLSPTAASNLADEVDFISFHFFAPADELAGGYATLRAAEPDRAIVMSEFGLPTWNSFLFPNGHTEAEQAVYYADILRTMRES